MPKRRVVVESKLTLDSLSPAMIRVMGNLHRGEPAWHHLRGRSEHGGSVQTEMALHKRGLVVDGQLTALGQWWCQLHFEGSAPLPVPSADVR